MRRPSVLGLILSLITEICYSCALSGIESGDCVAKETIISQTPFCREYIPSRVCVPYEQILWKDEFSIIQKDAEVESIFYKNIQDKLIFEYETSTRNLKISRDPNCYKTYKEFLCRWNFPLCVASKSKDAVEVYITVPLCSTLCTNYMTKCGFQVDKCTTEFTYSPGLNDGAESCS